MSKHKKITPLNLTNKDNLTPPVLVEVAKVVQGVYDALNAKGFRKIKGDIRECKSKKAVSLMFNNGPGDVVGIKVKKGTSYFEIGGRGYQKADTWSYRNNAINARFIVSSPSEWGVKYISFGAAAKLGVEGTVKKIMSKVDIRLKEIDAAEAREKERERAREFSKLKIEVVEREAKKIFDFKFWSLKWNKYDWSGDIQLLFNDDRGFGASLWLIPILKEDREKMSVEFLKFKVETLETKINFEYGSGEVDEKSYLLFIENLFELLKPGESKK